MSKLIKRKICPHCHEIFEAKRKNHLYCSNSCRVMACYRRKGYVYQSGHYIKESSAPLGKASVLKSDVAHSCTDIPTVVPVTFSDTEQTGMKDLSVRRVDEISMAGVLENAIGSGIVAIGKHILFDRDEAKIIKETLSTVREILRLVRLQQQPAQPGQGILQPKKGIGRQLLPPVVKTNPDIRLQTKVSPDTSKTTHQQILKRMGLDPNKYG